MANKVNNMTKEQLMISWRYFYRMQICEVGQLEQRLHNLNVNLKKAQENADEKKEEKYQKLVNKTIKKYNSELEKLDIIEKLHNLIITDNYSLSEYKEFNIIKEKYEEKKSINFTGTGYVFKQHKKKALGFEADLFKDGKKVISI